MIDKKQIIKMVRDVIRHDRGYPDRRIMHPKREWGIGLGVFAVVLLLGSFVTGELFVTYKNVDATAGQADQSAPRYRSVIVQDALERFRAKDSHYTELQALSVHTSIPTASTSKQATPQTEPVEETGTDSVTDDAEQDKQNDTTATPPTTPPQAS